MDALKNIERWRQATAKLILGAALLERLEKDPRASADFVAYQRLYRMDLNTDISSRIVTCQLY